MSAPAQASAQAHAPDRSFAEYLRDVEQTDISAESIKLDASTVSEDFVASPFLVGKAGGNGGAAAAGAGGSGSSLFVSPIPKTIGGGGGRSGASANAEGKDDAKSPSVTRRRNNLDASSPRASTQSQSQSQRQSQRQTQTQTTGVHTRIQTSIQTNSSYQTPHRPQGSSTAAPATAPPVYGTPRHAAANQGFLSPFSPLLKKRQDRDELSSKVSLQPCRKVSVIVRVCEEKEPGERQQCIFPQQLMPEAGEQSTSSDAKDNAINASKSTERDLVVVKPSAFGRYIPSHVTMETAKLVAQVAHISSEDWARLYEFNHVMWSYVPSAKAASSNGHSPNTIQSTTSETNGKEHHNTSTMPFLAKAVAQDAVIHQQSTCVVSIGHKTNCLGSEGLILRVLHQLQSTLPDKAVAMISVLEADDDEELLDMLVPPKMPPSNITIRHTDTKGAQLVGLIEQPIDATPSLTQALSGRKRRKRRRKHTARMSPSRASSASPGVSFFLTTINIWDTATHYESSKPPTSVLTFVELALPHFTSPASSASVSSASINDSFASSTAAGHSGTKSMLQKKSTVTLGNLLRAMLIQEHALGASIMSFSPGMRRSTATGTPQAVKQTTLEPSLAVSYRESLLTKLLQRPLEQHSSKVVVIGSISPYADEYDATVGVLSFCQRLLVRPGKTASSPFKASSRMEGDVHKSLLVPTPSNSDTATNSNDAVPSSPALKELAKSDHLLEQVLSDPRQRLAKIFKSPKPKAATPASPSIKVQRTPTRKEYNSHSYRPSNYMTDFQQFDVKAYIKGPRNAPPPKSPAARSQPIPANDSGVPSGNDMPEEWAPPPSSAPVTVPVNNTEPAPTPAPAVRNPLQSRIPRYSAPAPQSGNRQPPSPKTYPKSAPRTHNPDLPQSASNVKTVLFQSVEEHRTTTTTNHHVHETARWSTNPTEDQKEPSIRAHHSRHPSYFDDQQSNEGGNMDHTNDGANDDGDNARYAKPIAITPTVGESPLKRYIDHTSGIEPTNILDDTISEQQSLSLGPQPDATEQSVDTASLPNVSMPPNKPDQSLDMSKWSEWNDENDDHDDDGDNDVAADRDGAYDNAGVQDRDLFGSNSHNNPLDISANQTPQKSNALSANASSDSTTPLFSEMKVRSPASTTFVVNNDGFFKDIESLESSINRIRTIDSTLWQQIALAVQRLKESSISQQYMLETIVGERDDFKSLLDVARDDFNTVVANSRDEMQRRDDEIASLRERLETSIHERREVEKVAEEVTAAQSDLEQQMSVIQKSFADAQKSMEMKDIQAQEMQQEKAGMKDQLNELGNKLQAISKDFKNQQQTSADHQKMRQEAEETKATQQKEIESLRQTIQELNIEVRVSQSKAKKLESTAEQFMQSSNEKSEAVQQLHSQILKLEGEQDVLTREKIVLEEEGKAKDGEISRLFQNGTELQQANASMQAENETLKSQLDEATQHQQQMKGGNQELTKRIGDLQKTKAELEGQNRSLGLQMNELRQAKSATESEKDKMQRQILELQRMKNAVEIEKQDLAVRLDASSHAIDDKNREVAELEGGKETLLKHNIDLQAAEKEAQITIHKLDHEVETLKATIGSLEKQQASSYQTRLSESDKLNAELYRLKVTADNTEQDKMHLERKLKTKSDLAEQLQEQLREELKKGNKLRMEHDELTASRLKDMAMIERLQEDIRKGLGKDSDIDRLHAELAQLRQENVGLESALTTRKSEYFHDVSAKEEEAGKLRMQLERSSAELAALRESERKSAELSDRTILELQARIEDLERQLSELRKENSSLQMDLDSALHRLQQSEAGMSRAGEDANHLRTENRRLTIEVQQFHEEIISQKRIYESKIVSMETTLSSLQLELKESQRKNLQLQEQFDSQNRLFTSNSLDQDQLKSELRIKSTTIERLEHELLAVRDDYRRSEDRITDMKIALESFQTETKRRILERERSSSDDTQRFSRERRDLLERVALLESSNDRVRRERDLCLESLHIGRERLSRLASKSNDFRGFEDIFRQIPDVVSPGTQSSASAWIEEEDYAMNNHPTNVNIGSRSSGVHQTIPVQNSQVKFAAPELYVTRITDDLHTSAMKIRAEEIAACLAMSAKNSLQESQDEASQLRSHVYQLEEEKEIEVASLKARIRSLETELTSPRHHQTRPMAPSTGRPGGPHAGAEAATSTPTPTMAITMTTPGGVTAARTPRRPWR